MGKEDILISDEIWKKLCDTAAGFIPEHADQAYRQKVIKAMRRVMIEELDVDFGTPW